MNSVLRVCAVLVALISTLQITTAPVQAEQLRNRSVMLGDNRGSATTTWELGLQYRSATPVAAVSFQVCVEDPFPDNVCTGPDDMSFAGATLVSQTGNIGFSISPLTTTNRLLLERASSAPSQTDSTYRLAGVKNPRDLGSYYVRIQTYQTSYAGGNSIDYGGLAFNIARNVQITAIVPPYLLFCVGITVAGLDCTNVVGDFVNFGELSSRQASVGSTQMLAATNAIDGYTIRVNGPTMTSGNNVITNLVGSDVSRPGTSQFGFNLRANASPQGGQDAQGVGIGLPTNGYNQVNSFRFNSGDVIAASNAPDNARKYTATYVVNVPRTQSPGAYVTTLTYTALGSF